MMSPEPLVWRDFRLVPYIKGQLLSLNPKIIPNLFYSLILLGYASFGIDHDNIHRGWVLGGLKLQATVID